MSICEKCFGYGHSFQCRCPNTKFIRLLVSECFETVRANDMGRWFTELLAFAFGLKLKNIMTKLIFLNTTK